MTTSVVHPTQVPETEQDYRRLSSEALIESMRAEVKALDLLSTGDRIAALLPMIDELKRRFQQRGRRKVIAGYPSYSEALKDIGLNDSTVRTWRRSTKALLKVMGDAHKEDAPQYWITPPELWALLRNELGFNIDCDPCPHPRPPGYDGLSADWGTVVYCNPPFGTKEGVGISHWIKKAKAEYAKGGKTIVFALPAFQGQNLGRLVEAGAQVVSIGLVNWLDLKDGKTPNPRAATRRQPCFLAILADRESCDHRWACIKCGLPMREHYPKTIEGGKR